MREFQELVRRTTDMKHLVSVAVAAAALVIAAPVWAQNPSGGNSLGVPGPNPGGPGLTPYSGGGAPPPPPAPMPATPPTAAEAPPPANSAMPPSHHHRAYHHAKAMRNFHRGMAQKAALTGDTTAQLNRQELARIQTGNTGGAPPGPAMPGK
jgi:hypothetical protein